MTPPAYEKIGSRLYQKLKSLPANDPDRKELERFIWKYAEAPLFLVGFSDEDLAVDGIDPEWPEYFKLPYSTILLEYPKASYRPVFQKKVSPIVYVSEHDGKFYVEILVLTEELTTEDTLADLSRAMGLPQEVIGLATAKAGVLTLSSFLFRLKDGEIEAEEEFQKYTADLKGYTSKTLGISFIDRMEVSFRSIPTQETVIHELGHIHFREPDPIWSASYGGGETLVRLALGKGFHITESEVRLYHTILHDARTRPDKLAKEITEKISQRLKLECQPHLYCYELFAGTIPTGLFEQMQKREWKDQKLWNDLNDPRWLQLIPTRDDVLHFVVNLTEGLKWNDPFYTNYAVALGLVRECPVCERIRCTCD